MNKELYLNETTNVGLVVDYEKKLKRVESNENEDTVKILSLQNEIERKNKYLTMFKELLETSKENIKWKKRFWGVNVFIILTSIFMNLGILAEVSLLKGLIIYLGSSSIITMFIQLISYCMFGTFAENKFYIKELPKGIEKSEDKIKSLEEELKNLKEKCNYNENKLTNEDVIKIATVNYPERTNNETLVSDIQIPAKIKKITFNHNGTTK